MHINLEISKEFFMNRRIITLFLLAFINSNVYAIDAGINGHTAGDVIAVKTDDQIAAWCNFNKQIVTTQFNVLCIYNGSKKSINNS